MGWGEEPSKVLIALVTRQLRDESMHAYFKECVSHQLREGTLLIISR